MSAQIHSAIESESVDSALASLVSNGLKKTAFDGIDLFPKDIAVNVSTQLQREKDRTLPHRSELATQVCDTVSTELQSVFRGDSENAAATIFVRILLVSDGSSKGSQWKAKGGLGKAKLTLAWFLVANESNKVVLANQIYLTGYCSLAANSLDHLEFSGAVVRSLGRNGAAQIEEELTSAIIDLKQNPRQGLQKTMDTPNVNEVHEQH